MSRVAVGHGWKDGGAAWGPAIPNPHPPTGQEDGSGPRRAGSGAGVPEA
jgi:hypothetical protein